MSQASMAADTLLQMAGRTVLLRMPFLASAGDVTEQLGLATPQFQDVELGPAVFRRARATVSVDGGAKGELMVSATAVALLVPGADLGSVRSFFAGAVGVVIDGVLMEIVSVTSADVGGCAYLYRIGLQTPLLI